ncbi:hypothetical protein CL634_05350 [bacterium]|nr:hypothetical protein [bacterium]
MNIWDSYFQEWTKDKRIALVGPGESAIGKKRGEFIDSFDIVSRVKSITYPEKFFEDLGERCDILYTTNPFDRVDVIKQELCRHQIGETVHKKEKYEDFDYLKKVKCVVCTYPEEEWFSERFIKDFEQLKASGITKVRYANPESYFKAKIDTSRPNSGFSAILDILSFDIGELHMFGLDFHRSMYRSDYQNSLYNHQIILDDTTRSDGGETHQPDKQFRYFKYKIYNIDKRVKVDEELEHYLNDEKYEKIYE